MLSSNYFGTRLLVEKFDGICKISDWTIDHRYAKPIPNNCIIIEAKDIDISREINTTDALPEFNENNASILPANAMVTIEQLQEFKRNNSKVQKILVYTGTMLDYQTILTERFTLNKTTATSYYNFLLEKESINAYRFGHYSDGVFQYLISKRYVTSHLGVNRVENNFDISDVFNEIKLS